MLCLSRKLNESIVIDGEIEVMVIGIRGDKVRLGVNAPTDIPVHRREVQDDIDRERERGGKSATVPMSPLQAVAATLSPTG